MPKVKQKGGQALLDLIVDIVVKATLKEYYQTNDCLENEQE